MAILHPIDPVFDRNSKVLILGSFPSSASRSAGFFYAHPRNRFWRVMTDVLDWPEYPETIADRRSQLLLSRVALWDVLARCDIRGSADQTIRNAEPNDLSEILRTADLSAVFCNGSTAYSLFLKYYSIALPVVRLPSTSPANAVWSLERLTVQWSRILEYLPTPP